MKKTIALILTLSLVLGCTAALAGSKVGFSCPDGTAPYYIALEAAVRGVVEANGDELVAPDPQNNMKKQLSQIDEMIDEGVKAVFLCPVDSDGIIPGLEKLRDEGIPVFGFGKPVGDKSLVITCIESDNYSAGMACGNDLAEKTPGGGKVIVLGSPTTQLKKDRVNGFLDAIGDKGFEVVWQKDCGNSQEQSIQDAEEALMMYPDAAAIFCVNDDAALGAAFAAEDLQSGALIYSVGGSPEVKALIAEGRMAGAAAESPISIGETVANLFYVWMDGATVEEEYFISTVLLNSDCISDYNNGGWQ